MPVATGWFSVCFDAEICMHSGGRFYGVSGLVDYVALFRREGKCGEPCYVVLVNSGGEVFYGFASERLFTYLERWADAYSDGSMLLLSLETAYEAALDALTGKVWPVWGRLDRAALEAIVSSVGGGVSRDEY